MLYFVQTLSSYFFALVVFETAITFWAILVFGTCCSPGKVGSNEHSIKIKLVHAFYHDASPF